MHVYMTYRITGNYRWKMDTLLRHIQPRSRPAKDRLGSQNKPILHIELDKIVIDELHLRLRIVDVLVRNIVHEVIHADKLANRNSAVLLAVRITQSTDHRGLVDSSSWNYTINFCMLQLA